jgi:hypothetical protein
MAVWALLPGVPAAILAFGFGSIVGLGVGASAAIGVVAAVGAFAGQALALGWARHVSLTAIQVVAYAGFLVLIGVVAGVYAGLNATASWFSPKAYGGGLFALVPVALYEAYLARRGRVAELIVDADRAAMSERAERAERDRTNQAAGARSKGTA